MTGCVTTAADGKSFTLDWSMRAIAQKVFGWSEGEVLQQLNALENQALMAMAKEVRDGEH